MEPVHRLPLAPFWKTQQKLARDQAGELSLKASDLLSVSGVTLEPGGRQALVTFALTREVLVVELGSELSWSLLPLDVEPPAGEGFMGLNWVRAHPTASPGMLVVEDAHLGGGGMDPNSTVGLVNVKTRARVLNLTDSKFCEGTVAWRLSPNRRWLAASFYDDDACHLVLSVFDTRDGKLVHKLDLPPDDDFYGQRAVGVDEAGTSVAFADDRSLRVYDVSTGEQLFELVDEDTQSVALTVTALLASGGERPPRVLDRASQIWRSLPKECQGGPIADVRDGRAALVRGAGAIEVVNLANATATTLFPKGARGGEWLVAHDLDSGCTAAVSKKELLVFEPARGVR